MNEIVKEFREKDSSTDLDKRLSALPRFPSKELVKQTVLKWEHDNKVGYAKDGVKYLAKDLESIDVEDILEIQKFLDVFTIAMRRFKWFKYRHPEYEIIFREKKDSIRSIK